LEVGHEDEGFANVEFFKSYWQVKKSCT
jgi:hypothetical protein